MILDLALSDGRTISQLGAADGTRAILVVDPFEWRTCANGVAAWLNWERHGEREMFLVLTSQPTEFESRQLALAGIRYAGVLQGRPPVGTPLQIVLRAGKEPDVRTGMTDEVAYRTIAGLDAAP